MTNTTLTWLSVSCGSCSTNRTYEVAFYTPGAASALALLLGAVLGLLVMALGLDAAAAAGLF